MTRTAIIIASRPEKSELAIFSKKNKSENLSRFRESKKMRKKCAKKQKKSEKYSKETDVEPGDLIF